MNTLLEPKLQSERLDTSFILWELIEYIFNYLRLCKTDHHFSLFYHIFRFSYSFLKVKLKHFTIIWRVIFFLWLLSQTISYHFLLDFQLSFCQTCYLSNSNSWLAGTKLSFLSCVRRKETNKQDCFILNIKLELPACIVYLCVPVELALIDGLNTFWRIL